MTRICDECKKVIPLGDNHIEVMFIGMNEVEALFNTSKLDFCSLKCLVKYWSEGKYEQMEK